MECRIFMAQREYVSSVKKVHFACCGVSEAKSFIIAPP